MPAVCMLATFASLQMMGCATKQESTLSRKTPITLSVKQNTTNLGEREFLFCTPNGGAWSCDDTATKKTSYKQSTLDLGIKSAATPENKANPINGVGSETTLTNSTGSVARISPENKQIVINFKFDHYELTDEAIETLDTSLKGVSTKHFVIQSYTDAIGTKPYNNQLAENRSEAVKMYLVQKGFDPNEIETNSDGLCCYIADNSSDEGRAKNRRSEIKILVK